MLFVSCSSDNRKLFMKQISLIKSYFVYCLRFEKFLVPCLGLPEYFCHMREYSAEIGAEVKKSHNCIFILICVRRLCIYVIDFVEGTKFIDLVIHS